MKATIYVTRGEDVEIEVEVSGHSEYYGSHNPHERGLKVELDDYAVIGEYDTSEDPVAAAAIKDFKLINDEYDEALQALAQGI